MPPGATHPRDTAVDALALERIRPHRLRTAPEPTAVHPAVHPARTDFHPARGRTPRDTPTGDPR